MARPRKTLTDEQIKQVEKLAAVMTQEEIGDFFGITDRTLRQRIRDDPRVASAYKIGRAKAVRCAGEGLMSLVRKKNLGAICFYLKTQAGWRETNRTEVTGADGAPLDVRVDDVRDRIAARLGGIASRIAEPVASGAPSHANGNGANGHSPGSHGNGAHRP